MIPPPVQLAVHDGCPCWTSAQVQGKARTQRCEKPQRWGKHFGCCFGHPDEPGCTTSARLLRLLRLDQGARERGKLRCLRGFTAILLSFLVQPQAPWCGDCTPQPPHGQAHGVRIAHLSHRASHLVWALQVFGNERGSFPNIGTAVRKKCWQK